MAERTREKDQLLERWRELESAHATVRDALRAHPAGARSLSEFEVLRSSLGWRANAGCRSSPATSGSARAPSLASSSASRTRGLVTRAICDHDRRGINAMITDAGARPRSGRSRRIRRRSRRRWGAAVPAARTSPPSSLLFFFRFLTSSRRALLRVRHPGDARRVVGDEHRDLRLALFFSVLAVLPFGFTGSPNEPFRPRVNPTGLTFDAAVDAGAALPIAKPARGPGPWR